MADEKDKKFIRESIDACFFGMNSDPCLAERIRADAQKEKEMKKTSLRMVAIIAACIVLTIGVVYAATEWGMIDIFSDRYGVPMTEEAKTTMKEQTINQSIAVGDLTFTVNKALYDGHTLYFTVNAARTDGAKALYMGDTEYFEDRVSYEDENDTRTFGEMAAQENLPLYAVSVSEDNMTAGDKMTQSDGSALMLGISNHSKDAVAGESEKTFTLEFSVLSVAPDGSNDVSKIIRETLDITLPVLPMIEEKTYRYDSAIENGDIAGLVITLKRSILTTYMHAEISLSKPKTPADDIPWPVILDGKDGEMLGTGLTLGGGGNLQTDTLFVAEDSIAMDALPDTIYVRLREFNEKTLCADLTLTAE